MQTHFISMGPEGQMYINEGSNDEGNLIVELSTSTIADLDLFDESKPNFDYAEDGERVATLLRWKLEAKGYAVADLAHFTKMVRYLCEPGGLQSQGGYIVNLFPPPCEEIVLLKFLPDGNWLAFRPDTYSGQLSWQSETHGQLVLWHGKHYQVIYSGPHIVLEAKDLLSGMTIRTVEGQCEKLNVELLKDLMPDTATIVGGHG